MQQKSVATKHFAPSSMTSITFSPCHTSLALSLSECSETWSNRLRTFRRLSRGRLSVPHLCVELSRLDRLVSVLWLHAWRLMTIYVMQVRATAARDERQRGGHRDAAEGEFKVFNVFTVYTHLGLHHTYYSLNAGCSVRIMSFTSA
jgi:hypothetical protein